MIRSLFRSLSWLRHREHGRAIWTAKIQLRRSASKQRNLLNYDVIVVGVGATGCSALYHLAKQNCKVLGIEKRADIQRLRFPESVYHFHCPVHYFEILQRSINLWKRIEDECDEAFVMDTGSLYCGVHYDAVYEAIESFGLDHEEMRGFTVPRRFPQLSLPLREDVLYIDNGGIINNVESLRALFEVTRDHGAKFRFNEEVVSWNAGSQGVKVETNKSIHTGQKLILACGASTKMLVPELEKAVQTSRKTMTMFRLKRSFSAVSAAPIPVLQYDVSEAECVRLNSTADELNVCLNLDEEYQLVSRKKAKRTSFRDERGMERVMKELCPGIASTKPISVLTETVCRTSDNEFILDRHPASQNVMVYQSNGNVNLQYAPAFGEMLSLMATDKDQRISPLLHPFSFHRKRLRTQFRDALHVGHM